MTKKSKGAKSEQRIIDMEIWKEFINVQPQRVQISQVYLDPNNPRLQTPKKQKVQDIRITEDGIQENCLEELKKEGINDLYQSIKTSGFWTMDRVVLRPLKDGKFVVIEGNRRIAALKTLEKNHQTGKETLSQKVFDSIKQFEALVYRGNNSDISWIIQGFRHSPGIKSWKDYPKAMFLAKFEKQSKKPPNEIASIFGMKGADVTHLIRSYSGFENAAKDKEYGNDLTPDKFGHFGEIIFKQSSIQKWLEWDDTKRQFANKTNLKKYLKLATQIDAETDKPRIDITPTTRDVFSEIVKPEHKDFLDKFEEGKIKTLKEIEKVLDEESEKREPIDIPKMIDEFEYAKKVAETLPIPSLQLLGKKEDKTEKKKLIKVMEELKRILEQQLKNLGKA